MSAPGEGSAPDHEALLSTVETTGAALVAALEACVAAGLPVWHRAIEDSVRAADTRSIRAALEERARPKGPMVTIKRSNGGTYQEEVEKISEARIILRNGHHYSIANGYRTGPWVVAGSW